MRDQKGHLVADCHSILARWRNYFSKMSIVQGVNAVRQTEIDIAEPLVPQPNAFGVDMATEEVKRYKSPVTDQVPPELIKAGGKTVHSEFRNIFCFE